MARAQGASAKNARHSVESVLLFIHQNVTEASVETLQQSARFLNLVWTVVFPVSHKRIDFNLTVTVMHALLFHLVLEDGCSLLECSHSRISLQASGV